MSYDPRPGEIESKTRHGSRHTLRWTEWGNPGNTRLVVCAHGLSRNGRDFDFLARRLAKDYRVLCPDYPGRGVSDVLYGEDEYTNQQYLLDTEILLASLEFETLDWVGTSMGGLIGMGLAASAGNPIRRMVVNDVGPFIPAASLQLIKSYLNEHPRFRTLQQAEQYFRTVYAGFGRLESHHYDHLVEHGVKFDKELDHYVLACDPKVIDSFVAAPSEDVDIWSVWEAIRIPVLVIRGGKSGLLLAATVERMKQSRPGVESVEFADCGHAPSLMVDTQIDVVGNWLLAAD